MSEAATSTSGGSESSGSEAIVKTGASSAITFDELGALESAGVPQELKADVKEAKRELKAKNKAKEEKEDGDKLGRDGSSSESDVSEGKTKKAKGKEGDENEQEEDSQKGEKSQQVKTVKVKAGDQDLEIPNSAPVPVKINGKDSTVPLQELINNYSGKTNYDKKFNDLALEKKQVQNQKQELQEINNRVQQLAEMFQSGDARFAMTSLVEALGGNGDEWWGKLVSSIETQAQKLSELTPEQKEALKAKEEADYYRKRLEQESKSKVQTKELGALKSRVETEKQRLGITHEQFEETYHELKGLMSEGKLKFSDPDKEFTPEYIGQYIEAKTRLTQIAGLTDIIPDAKKEQATELLFTTWNSNPNFTVEDMKEIALELYGRPSKSTASKSLAEKVESKKGTSEPKFPQREPISFDDL